MLKKKEDPQHEFVIRVKYLLHLQSEYEDTFLSLFVPCTKFCLGWEPLLDKKYTLRYQVTMVRLRGKQEFKVKANYIEDYEAAVPSQAATKEKTIGDRIGDFVSSITSKKDDDKKKDEDKEKKDDDKEHRHRRRHRRHRRHRHRKHSDTDSSTGSSSSDGDSGSSDDSSGSEREHRKKHHHHHKSKPVEQLKGNEDKSTE